MLWLRLPLPFRPDHLNVYALDDGDGWTIVDTGLGTPGCREAWAALLAGPLGGRPVRRVILTHHHPDHVGLAGWFQARGAELLATRTAWLMARMLTLDVQERPLPETLAFWRRAGMPAEMLAERAEQRPFNFADVVAPMPLGYTRIGQGDEIVAGGRRWRVEVGHGHAPEQATLWGVGHDLVLVGDQVLPGITPNLGVHATEPDADPVGEWLASCARLLALAREDHLALPGHRRPFHGLPARLAELIAHQEEGLARLRDFLATPRPRGRLLRHALRPADRRGRVRAGAGRGGRAPEPAACAPARRCASRRRTAPGPGGGPKLGLTAAADRARKPPNRSQAPEKTETRRMAEQHDSKTDVAEHQRTFEGFIRFWGYVFGGAILILIFLALFNS